MEAQQEGRRVEELRFADQVSIWRNKRGFTDESVKGHNCSGKTCTYSHIEDVFLCEKTGRVHACDDTCREAVWDQSSGLLEQPQADEMEPFMGSGRFARAYLLGYSCIDDKELEAALRFC
ncbi:hypothetical protein KSP40_PGU022744 [Platanthera guangdongensis]|uniref:F-box protein n=1 Tax=Platanthera guangdongensis TaxID=2320717 RepID=A0ABR2MN70_9ASPA